MSSVIELYYPNKNFPWPRKVAKINWKYLASQHLFFEPNKKDIKN